MKIRENVRESIIGIIENYRLIGTQSHGERYKIGENEAAKDTKDLLKDLMDKKIIKQVNA